ncbi:MAG: hypothetical protein K940chlam9_00697 [Chlamydiae bacterium]|nr:hypothetical protein [Chlamydiota bacterium]
MKERLKVMSGKYCKILLFLLFFLPSPLSANGYLVLDTGYRYDRINSNVEYVTKPNRTPYFSDENNFQNIQSYQLGAKGAWQIPCTCVIVKGEAHYSWILHGTYNEQYLAFGDLGGNYFIDASGGIGYSIPLCNCLHFIPYIGGSYDRANMRITNANNPFGEIPDHQGDRWWYSWYGPWVGFDLEFEGFCSSTFTAGYEFHYGWAYEKTVPNNPSPMVFAYHADYSNVSGNTFHLQWLQTICANWLWGLKVEYGVWSNHHKENAIPDVPPTGFTPGMIQKQAGFTWQSFSATANLGFCF